MTAWNGPPNAMEKLWHFIEKDDGVLASRRARENSGEARARGYSSRPFDDLDVADEADGSDPENLFSEPAKSQAWCRDRVSGSPSMISETILDLISMGFKPQLCAVLREKIQQHMKLEGPKVSMRGMQRYHGRCGVSSTSTVVRSCRHGMDQLH